MDLEVSFALVEVELAVGGLEADGNLAQQVPRHDLARFARSNAVLDAAQVALHLVLGQRHHDRVREDALDEAGIGLPTQSDGVGLDRVLLGQPCSSFPQGCPCVQIRCRERAAGRVEPSVRQEDQRPCRIGVLSLELGEAGIQRVADVRVLPSGLVRELRQRAVSRFTDLTRVRQIGGRVEGQKAEMVLR